jgi:hypothetical protein
MELEEAFYLADVDGAYSCQEIHPFLRTVVGDT